MMTAQLDQNGFLKDLSTWTPSFSEEISKEEKLSLSQDHWTIIYFFQHFYQEYQLTPTMRVLIKYLKTQWPEEKANSLYVQTLFPKSVILQASRLAGLPKPPKCL